MEVIEFCGAHDAGRALTSSVVINKPNSSLIVDQPRGGGTYLYSLYGYMQPKMVGFSAILVINRVSILAHLPPFWS